MAKHTVIPLQVAKYKDLSDSEAIQLYLRTRDSSYFDLLYKRYGGKVYAKSISLLKDEAAAFDATQEIFIKIFLNLSKFGGQSKFSTWIYSITYNYCIDVIRKGKKGKHIFSEDIETTPDVIDEVEDEMLLTMQIDRLKVVLDNLPVGDKAVLLMKYHDDMSILEISEALGKSESAVKMKILRAKQKARSIYDERFKD